MNLLIPVLLLALGYLSGSVNYAIIVTWLIRRVDIRTLGNGNPGTANVGRNVGRGPAALVFFLDVFKGLGPMLLARSLTLPAGPPWQALFVGAVGMAAIAGHCKPVFFGFRGGGGIATAIGVYALFIPAELLLSLLLSFLAAVLFLRGVRHRIGQWVPILFVALAPFLTAALNLVIAVPLPGGATLGGHGWEVPVVVLALSLFILALNFSFMGRRLEEIGGGQAHFGT